LSHPGLPSVLGYACHIQLVRGSSYAVGNAPSNLDNQLNALESSTPVSTTGCSSDRPHDELGELLSSSFTYSSMSGCGLRNPEHPESYDECFNYTLNTKINSSEWNITKFTLLQCSEIKYHSVKTWTLLLIRSTVQAHSHLFSIRYPVIMQFKLNDPLLSDPPIRDYVEEKPLLTSIRIKLSGSFQASVTETNREVVNRKPFHGQLGCLLYHRLRPINESLANATRALQIRALTSSVTLQSELMQLPKYVKTLHKFQCLFLDYISFTGDHDFDEFKRTLNLPLSPTYTAARMDVQGLHYGHLLKRRRQLYQSVTAFTTLLETKRHRNKLVICTILATERWMIPFREIANIKKVGKHCQRLTAFKIYATNSAVAVRISRNPRESRKRDLQNSQLSIKPFGHERLLSSVINSHFGSGLTNPSISETTSAVHHCRMYSTVTSTGRCNTCETIMGIRKYSPF
ncbi:hypothetical protein CLF_100835, partial [Clonorchis sinensis]